MRDYGIVNLVVPKGIETQILRYEAQLDAKLRLQEKVRELTEPQEPSPIHSFNKTMEGSIQAMNVSLDILTNLNSIVPIDTTEDDLLIQEALNKLNSPEPEPEPESLPEPEPESELEPPVECEALIATQEVALEQMVEPEVAPMVEEEPQSISPIMEDDTEMPTVRSESLDDDFEEIPLFNRHAKKEKKAKPKKEKKSKAEKKEKSSKFGGLFKKKNFMQDDYDEDFSPIEDEEIQEPIVEAGVLEEQETEYNYAIRHKGGISYENLEKDRSV